jgi:hypothetical protein
LLQGADGRVQGSQLTLGAITPEGQHLQFALLMAAAVGIAVIDTAATADRGKHRKRDQGSTF